MINMIRADLFKMFKSSAIKVLFAITLLCAVTMTIIAYMIQKGQISLQSTGVGFLFSDINVVSILGAVIAGIFICGDYENKTIHNSITCGYSRGYIVVSKAVVFFSGVMFILIPYIITVIVALFTGFKFSMGSVSTAFLHILTQEAGIAFQADDILKLLIIMFTILIVYLAQLSICVPIAITLKKPVFVVAIYYALSITCGQLSSLMNSSELLKNIFLCTPFGGNYLMLTLKSGAGDIVKALLVSVIFIIVMLVVTYGLFRKTEIK
jgi:ABC-2 type transport system permease protein